MNHRVPKLSLTSFVSVVRLPIPLRRELRALFFSAHCCLNYHLQLANILLYHVSCEKNATCDVCNKIVATQVAQEKATNITRALNLIYMNENICILKTKLGPVANSRQSIPTRKYQTLSVHLLRFFSLPSTAVQFTFSLTIKYLSFSGSCSFTSLRRFAALE